VARQYENKTALVTGASSGIGMEISRELARRGAHVILVARREELLARLAEQIIGEGGRATPMPCDVTDESAVNALAQQVKERFGHLHLLVNNAGKELLRPLQVSKPQAVREVMEVNVMAVVEVTRVLLGLIHHGGAIINMASAVGLVGTSGLAVYAASKGAVIALTRALAKELAGRRIRVNAVAPGMVKTEMADRLLNKLTAGQVAELEAAHPLGFGSPKDVALGVAFLGSDDAAWITGHTLVIDGGFAA
jgi:3-oxoacyl-[acyl-carrier protein] reductase